MNRFTIASAILGFFCIVAGAFWMYRPLGLLAGGTLLLVAAFMSARKR